jgi:hypothetical protein
MTQSGLVDEKRKREKPARMRVMQSRQWISIGMTLAALTIVPLAKAQPPHSLSRYLGVHWSDGYHSRTACPPKRGAAYFSGNESAPASGPAPWWKIPSPEAERLPPPAASQPGGASLFRQPGEGSSVMVR